MNLPGKRLLLGTAIAAAALGVGGVAYAAGNDPAPDQGYVTVEEGPSAGTPSTTPSDGSSAAPQGRDGTARDGKDCPDKAGSGGQQGAQPSQPEQGSDSQANPQSNA
ncbi:hypothetical protein [Streptomyces sp. SID13031]|uniref:hypothetical protein n=1 Tax=Streptomyces sp. SID13031 TaxID=2706046 RepID=UPI0013CB62E2|nr:hypothetical protein [Streptomyces sp. SID13031]NEA31491.1 hypothetical protein [Streptomyces sp. SID13031]